MESSENGQVSFFIRTVFKIGDYKIIVFNSKPCRKILQHTLSYAKQLFARRAFSFSYGEKKHRQPEGTKGGRSKQQQEQQQASVATGLATVTFPTWHRPSSGWSSCRRGCRRTATSAGTSTAGRPPTRRRRGAGVTSPGRKSAPASACAACRSSVTTSNRTSSSSTTTTTTTNSRSSIVS